MSSYKSDHLTPSPALRTPSRALTSLSSPQENCSSLAELCPGGDGSRILSLLLGAVMVWCWRGCSIRWTAACSRILQAGWAAWHTALAGPREWLDDILLSQQRVSPADLVLVSPLTLYQDGAGRHRAPDSRYLQCRDAISLSAGPGHHQTDRKCQVEYWPY